MDKGAAYNAGLMVNDEIIAMDGYRVSALSFAKRFKLKKIIMKMVPKSMIISHEKRPIIIFKQRFSF